MLIGYDDGVEVVESIANAIITKSRDRGIGDLTPMKLQKLLYFAHGWYLAIRDQPLFDDDIQAWRYGPVVYNIYREFKDCRDQPINRFAVRIDYSQDKGVMRSEPIPSANDEIWDLVDAVLRRYGDFSPVQLMNLTHEEGAPWHVVVDQCGGRLPLATNIPNELIKEHFRAKLENAA
ncbi:MAG: type II toxin-antitoxin system antitoxin SocA domain-containing protein [Planctomycetota bacterium]